MRRCLLVLMAMALVMGACTGTDPTGASRVRADADLPATPNTPPAPAPERRVEAASFSLERMTSCGVAVERLRARALEMVGPWGLGGSYAVAMPMAADAAAAESGGARAGSGGAAATATSSTNTQETSVDEPDLVEIDATRMFVADGGVLRGLRLDGGGATMASTLALPFPSEQLLLSGDRLVALGYTWADRTSGGVASDDAVAGHGSGPATSVAVVDVSDPGAMRVIEHLTLDGALVSARGVGGVVRLVTRTDGPRATWSTPRDQGDEEASTQRNQDIIRDLGTDAFLPRWSTASGGDGSAVGCEQVYVPKENEGIGTVNLITIDPADPRPSDGVSVVGAADTVYASTDRVYVAGHEWQRTEPVSGVVAPVVEDTSIHAFDISRREATYVGSGEVPGRLLSQWSMSEHDGFLRVATTEGAAWGAEPSSVSSVRVLEEQDGALAEIGHVGDLGRGERIQAVRFMGDRGFVVTFRQIDPLYTLDLTDPRSPKVRGELKVPGFSAYLHPVGEGLLLGLGVEANEQGLRTGAQIALYDVSDPAKPTQVERLTYPDAHLPAEHDHHAFLWWEGRAVTPLQPGDGEVPYSLVVDVVGRDLVEAGRITHPGIHTLRTVVRGDLLLTVSSRGVKANHLRTLEEVRWTPYS